MNNHFRRPREAESPDGEPDSLDDPRVLAAMAWYAERVDDGQVPDREVMLHRFPDVADQLTVCLEAFDLIQEAMPNEVTSLANASAESFAATLGDFRLVREIGRGGMGVVYEAEQLSLQRRVAIKVLPFASLLDRRQLERFRNEARAAAMLRHPNIVGVYSVGCERSVHFFAMDLVEGCNIADVIGEIHDTNADSTARHTPHGQLADTNPVAALSTRYLSDRRGFYQDVANLGRQVAMALQYAHQEGVIHRDIKPSNLLLDQDANVWITDFGLARIQTCNSLTLTGDVVGTLRYMSPEQLDGQAVVDQRSDIYSLGLTIYELLTGQPAFAGKNRHEILQRMLTEQLPPPRSVDSSIPIDLETIVLKATAREPLHRYRTAFEFADDLQRFAQNRPVLTRRDSVWRRNWQWCRTHRSQATLLALVVGLLLTAAVVGQLLAVQQAKVVRQQQHALYDADMLRVYEHFTNNETDLAVGLLQKYLPENQHGRDYRHFEWHHLWRECQEHTSEATIDWWVPIYGVAYTPDGQSLAFGTWDGRITVVDPKTRLERWSAAPGDKETPHNGRINDLAFSPDSELLAVGSRDGVVAVWDVRTGKPLWSHRVDSAEIRSLALSTNNVLAVGLGRDFFTTSFPHQHPAEIQRWELTVERNAESIALRASSLPELSDEMDGDVQSLDFSPDGSMLAAVCHDDVLRIWDLTTGELRTSCSGHQGPVMDVKFSPDGRIIATASGLHNRQWLSGEVLLWDVGSGEQVQAIPGHDSVVRSIAFAARGSEIVTASDQGTIRVWDVASGKLAQEIRAHAGRIHSLAISPDGKTLASGGTDHRLRIWQLPKAIERRELPGHRSDVQSLAFSPDGGWLTSASSDRTLRIWSVDDRQPHRQLMGHSFGVMGMDLTPDGKFIASVASAWPPRDDEPAELVLWSARTGDLTYKGRLDNHKYVRSLAITPDGKHVVLGAGKAILLWNIASRQVVNGTKVAGSTFRVAATKNLVVASVNTPEGGQVVVLSYPELQPRREPIVQSKRNIYGIAVSVDGQILAVSDSDSNAIHLVDISNGREMRTLNSHTGAVLAMDFSNDGQRLASAGMDSSMIIWNVDTGNPVLKYRRPSGWLWATRFSPDDRSLAAGGSDADGNGVIHIIRAEARS